MILKLSEREREIILAHLKNSPIPWCRGSGASVRSDLLRQKLERHT